MLTETGFQLTETANTFQEPNLSGLTPEQVSIFRNYMSPYEGMDCYSARASFFLEYLEHPERFRPTEFAHCAAYCYFVARHFDGGEPPGSECTVWFPTDISYDKIDFYRLQNVQVSLKCGDSSTLEKGSVVLELTAQARKDTNFPWEDMRSDEVALKLEEWVEKIPEDTQAK